MPLEARPLFRPDVVGADLKNFDPPGLPGAREKLARWAELLATDRGERLKEQELLPDFLTDVFYGVLGRFGSKKAGDRFADALKVLRDEYVRTVEPMRARAVETLRFEREAGDLVNVAYGLTPA